MNLLKGCLRWIGLYLLIAAVFCGLVYIRYPNTRVALWGGGGAAMLVWFSIGYMNGLRERKKERRMVQRGMTTDRPEDGEKIAAIGMARSIESLHAPISRRPCLAYEYSMSLGGEETIGAYTGFALVPLTIDTPRGAIRLLAAPELSWEDEMFGGPQMRENARSYVASTTFKQHEGLDIKREVAHMKQVIADDDGRIRYDIQHHKAPDFSKLLFTEKVLLPGEKVVAIGRYSSARGGLVPDPTALMHPVKITKGDGEETLKNMLSKDRTDRAMGCGCLVPVILAALIGLTVVPLDAIEQMFPAKDPSWTEVRVERWIRRNVRPYVKVEQTWIDLQPNRARGKLFAGGVNVPLDTVSATRNEGWIELTFRGNGGPVAVARFLGENLESVQIGGRAVPAADVDIEQIHISEEEAVGRMTYVGSREGPHLRVAFRAKLGKP